MWFYVAELQKRLEVEARGKKPRLRLSPPFLPHPRFPPTENSRIQIILNPSDGRNSSVHS